MLSIVLLPVTHLAVDACGGHRHVGPRTELKLCPYGWCASLPIPHLAVVDAASRREAHLKEIPAHGQRYHVLRPMLSLFLRQGVEDVLQAGVDGAPLLADADIDAPAALTFDPADGVGA